MGLFGSKSSATSITEVEDARVTGVEASQVAAGGGSVVSVERLAPGTVELLGRMDQGRSDYGIAVLDAALGSVERQAGRAQSIASDALAGALAQRSSETETLGATISKLAPILLGVAALFALSRGGSR